MLSAVLALLLGFGVLAYFIPPHEWIQALEEVPRPYLLGSVALFLMGCLTVSLRWRACLAYRIGYMEAFHSQGIAMGGNLLIPGRTGEPLRVYALARRGLPAEFATSAIVQERLADQLFRLLFFAAALMVGGAGGAKEDTDFRLLGIVLTTLALFGLLALMIRYKMAMADFSGRWLGRLPKVNADTVERFVRETLTDLATVWSRPGGPAAAGWGLLGWLFFLGHMMCLFPVFFGAKSLYFALIAMCFGSPTSAGKPGGYHLVNTAVLVAFSAGKAAALKAVVVIYLFQTLIYSLWGIVGWFALRPGLTNDPEDGVGPPLEESPR